MRFLVFIYLIISTSAYSQTNKPNKYHILLIKQKFKSDYFNKYYDNEIYNIRSFNANGEYIYIAGKFNTIDEADTLLETIHELGFVNSKIIDSKELISLVGTKLYYNDEIVFTIQLKKNKTPLPTNFFANLENVLQFKDENNNFIYTYGKYKNYKTAKNYWRKIVSYGYDEAFIMNTERYITNLNKL